jgi:hypothetical protein
MSEIKKTLIFIGAAAGLLVLALVTAPGRPVPEAMSDVGGAFFPDFTDPNAARTLEVIEFDEETGAALPFKVTFKDGRWTIPSHHDYPADGEDRLAKTAAGVIGIHKDEFRTDNVADHASCGVIDPLDETATSLEGRGTRVTLKDEGERVLADFIVGKVPEERSGYRFVRIPGQKRVYVAKMDVDLSTRFEDWIEKDLLEVERDEIQQVVLEDYSIDERTRRVDQRDLVTLEKRDGEWEMDRLPSGRALDITKLNSLLTAVDGLSIVGVRPKPAGLSASLSQTDAGAPLTQGDLLSLQSKGFFLTRNGQLLSNEGEVQVQTTKGVIYTLRFGEVLYGSGAAITAGGEASDDEEGGPGENRYLFITASFDPKLLPEPEAPANTAFQDKAEADWDEQDRENKKLYDAHEEWKKTVEEGRTSSQELNRRFADWYYVIPASAFEKVHLQRRDLLKEQT